MGQQPDGRRAVGPVLFRKGLLFSGCFSRFGPFRLESFGLPMKTSQPGFPDLKQPHRPHAAQFCFAPAGGLESAQHLRLREAILWSQLRRGALHFFAEGRGGSEVPLDWWFGSVVGELFESPGLL